MIHKAKDLSPDQKLVLESLLGRHVLEQEAISVRAFEPPALSDQRRQEIANELKRYFSEVDANRRPTPDAQTDDIVTEAVRSTRASYRPR
jgi:hypothetical protein